MGVSKIDMCVTVPGHGLSLALTQKFPVSCRMLTALTAVTYLLLLPAVGLVPITAIKYANVAEVFVPMLQVGANGLLRPVIRPATCACR